MVDDIKKGENELCLWRLRVPDPHHWNGKGVKVDRSELNVALNRTGKYAGNVA